MNLEPALQMFVAESRELLEQMEQALLAVDAGARDADTVNALFRAAHTIKGSAGVFGLDDVVDFTHVVENVLDRLRDGLIEPDGELVTTLLAAADHIGALVAHTTAGDAPLPAALASHGQDLLAALAAEDAPAPLAPAVASAVQDRAAPPAAAADAVANRHWHVSVRFGADVLRNGMDPLSFIRYLERIGEVVSVRVIEQGLPPLTEFEPESCYLGFEIAVGGTVDKSTLSEAFAFVRDDCELTILPPESALADYVELMSQRPETPHLLGEILVGCGALTPAELARALAAQLTEPAALERPLGDILVAQGAVPPETVAAALETQANAREARGDTRFVRVDAAKLDQLINLVGEVVIAGANTNLLARRAGLPDLIASSAHLTRLVDEVRDNALGLRMVPIGGTFNRFHRVVRDVSRELGKEIDLVLRGGDTELDKTMVERLGDPLMHLVRNAIDHGIESADERRARGKPARGRVDLSARHESGSIVIEVSDDGGGLDRERVLDKAIERGLVSAGQVLSDHEVWQLVFEPGFSTASAVTSVSGRGVGMDVVKSNVTAMRGNIDIDTEPGLGTTVRIHLPLTLAIIDGFLVKAGPTPCVIPLDMVRECVELGADERAALRESGYVNLRGEVLPLLRLRDQFGADDSGDHRETVVVVRAAGRDAGLVVDELLGESQTVIKPLGRLFRHLDGISGSTILGSGDVALILDVPGLIQRVTDAMPRAGTAALH